MHSREIEIGTSGWKFDDWAGTFYPFRVPQTKWLEYYAARFNIGEVNSTYYNLGSERTYSAISKRTPDSFRLFVKVHADVTHVRQEPEASLRKLLTVLGPVRESGKLLGLVAQFPESFHCDEYNLNYVLRLKQLCEDVRLCVEFRHKSWDTPEVVNTIRSADLTWICPDEPQIGSLMPLRLQATSDILYLRLHGRNALTWHNSQNGNRYDYNYSAEELADFGHALIDYDLSITKTFLLFNNCHFGRAPQNALWLKEWLSIR
jgi:uncharacterized protein YecE (DUF72 family)